MPFLLAVVIIVLVGCASGSTIVTGATRAPIAPELVKIYLEPPPQFEVIGVISASSDAGMTEQGSLDYAVEELKKQAARIGANGVLLGATGVQTTTVFGGYGKTVQGRAVFIKSQ